MRRRASRLLSILSRREEGQALALTAVALVVLIGFAGIAIDIGRLYIAQRQLQQAVDAAALAAGQNLPHANTAYTSAIDYSALATEYNAHPSSMAADFPQVTFKCLNSLAPGLPCSTDLDGTGCHPGASQPPVTGTGAPTNVCNAVKVSETASVSTTLLHLFLPSSFTTVAASSTAAARGGVPHPLDIMVILDTTGSMASACGDAVEDEAVPPHDVMSSSQSAKIDCAKDGVRRLLKGLLPCAESVLGNCGFSPPLDEVGLEVFPALNAPDGFTHSTDTNPDHSNRALELNVDGSQCSGNLTNATRPAWYKPANGNFPGWFLTGSDVGYTTDNYLITPGLTNDYKLSNLSTSLNPQSVLARAVTWDACAGSAPPIHNGVPNSSYYGVNVTTNTFYADAINVAQSVIASDAARHAQGVIILLSDGDATTAPDGPNPCHEGIQAAQAAAAQGTWVYSIAYASSQSSGNSCRLDSPPISGFSAMQQMAYTYNAQLGQAQADPSKFYCVPAVAGCNSASTLAGVFASIGVDLTDSRLLLDTTS